MRRAMTLLILFTCAAMAFSAPPSRGAKAHPIMNAIGLIDYSTKPTFKPGDWVRYHVVGSNNEGDRDDYYVTVLIAGEEKFWGEDCFWIETRTQAAGTTAPMAIVTLMSYSIFDDSLAQTRLKLYMRKEITDVREDGTPWQELTKRPPLTMRNRKPPGEHSEWSVDTLGADTVQVPPGLYRCTKLKLEEGVARIADMGDSSSRTEVRNTRTVYMTPGVPITHFARERIEETVRHKSWLVGHSQEGSELKLVGLSAGDARLQDFGTGLESGLVPEQFRKSFREQAAAERAAVRPKPKRSS